MTGIKRRKPGARRRNPFRATIVPAAREVVRLRVSQRCCWICGVITSPQLVTAALGMPRVESVSRAGRSLVSLVTSVTARVPAYQETAGPLALRFAPFRSRVSGCPAVSVPLNSAGGDAQGLRVEAFRLHVPAR